MVRFWRDDKLLLAIVCQLTNGKNEKNNTRRWFWIRVKLLYLFCNGTYVGNYCTNICSEMGRTLSILQKNRREFSDRIVRYCQLIHSWCWASMRSPTLIASNGTNYWRKLVRVEVIKSAHSPSKFIEYLTAIFDFTSFFTAPRYDLVSPYPHVQPVPRADLLYNNHDTLVYDNNQMGSRHLCILRISNIVSWYYIRS